jgi:hypothetical protein
MIDWLRRLLRCLNTQIEATVSLLGLCHEFGGSLLLPIGIQPAAVI